MQFTSLQTVRRCAMKEDNRRRAAVQIAIKSVGDQTAVKRQSPEPSFSGNCRQKSGLASAEDVG